MCTVSWGDPGKFKRPGPAYLEGRENGEDEAADEVHVGLLAHCKAGHELGAPAQ